MALTELQKERIKFHLDFQRGVTDILSVGFNVNLGVMTATQERLIVGTLAGALAADIVEYDGEAICTNDSALGRVERAYSKLTVDTIDSSTFVRKAGAVELNPQEARNRRQFYQDAIRDLEKALGYAKGIYQGDTGGCWL